MCAMRGDAMREISVEWRWGRFRLHLLVLDLVLVSFTFLRFQFSRVDGGWFALLLTMMRDSNALALAFACMHGCL